MEVKFTLNRRFIFEALTVLELVLIVFLTYRVFAISNKLPSGAVGAVPNNAVAAGNNQPQPVGKVKPVNSEDYIRGDKSAPLTLIEYSDFECPFCKSFHPSVLKLLSDYPGQIKIVYRHFPLSFHANAQKEAEAAECVGSLAGAAKFYEFGDKIFERTTSNGLGFALDKLPKLAAEIGVNQKKFQECLDSGKFAAKVAQQTSEGGEAGVNGTPASFLINDKTGDVEFIEGAQPYAALKQAAEKLLKKS